MPVVTIQVTREGTKPGATSVTSEEKAALIKGTSELLRDVLGKPLEFNLRHHRGSRHRQLGLGRPARARISAEAGGDGRRPRAE